MHHQFQTSNRTSSCRRATAAVAALIASALWIAAPATASSPFTYQGVLKQSGQPASGSYEFEFKLYNAQNIQVGPTLNSGGDVVDGLFTAELDFGDTAFNGDTRWLQIGVRPESDVPPAYTILTPRQKITSAPQATIAAKAKDLLLPLQAQTSSAQTGFQITATGAGAAIAAVQSGTGIGEYIELSQPANPSPALWVNNQGSGPAILAQSGVGAAAALIGPVGIGTAEPEAALHISSGFNAAAVRFDATHYVNAPRQQLASQAVQVTEAAPCCNLAVWSNVQNATAQNGQSASVQMVRTLPGADSRYSTQLSFGGFNFAVPADATVTGVTVSIWGNQTATGSGSGPYADAECVARTKIVAGAATSWVAALTPTAGAAVSSGGENQLWGMTLTPAMVNAANFGVTLNGSLDVTTTGYSSWGGTPYADDCAFCSGNGTLWIDAVEVTVHYITVPVVPETSSFTVGIPEGGTKLVVAHGEDFTDRVLSINDHGISINTDTDDFGLCVVGGAAKPGGGSWSSFCDARLKSGIKPLSGTLERVLRLRGCEFEYTDEAQRLRPVLSGRQIGLIAQDVEEVFPDWVEEDADGYKFVTERATTALMVESLRDLRAEKDAQLAERDARIRDLEERLNRLERGAGSK